MAATIISAMPSLSIDSSDNTKLSQTLNDSIPTLSLQNELANSHSPYLRSHKDNLVAWQEWSPESIALAKTHQRPIFLSVGYNACHWCHVMSHESFESQEIATILNTSFIPIKVDRESRPDLDDIYMNYVTATTGSGGWPLNVFLTPDLEPFFGGTYWPSPGSETEMSKSKKTIEDRPMNFRDIVQKMQDIWLNERVKCLASATDIANQLRAFASEGSYSYNSVQVRNSEQNSEFPEPLDLDLLDDALDHFVAKYDSKYGGFSTGATLGGPKFPTPANLTFLLRIGASITRPSTHTRFGFPSPVPGILGRKSCATAASMALHTLQCMSRSALRDHLGNGFHRYSVTPDWNLPHFEKMLYDNAQLLDVYCNAWALARDPEVLGSIYDLVEYLTNPESPIVREGGGWYASEDADSKPSLATTNNENQEKREGAFYTWTLKELQTLLGDRDSSIVARHFGILEHGNISPQLDVKDEFISQNVLHIDATPSVLAKEFGLKDEEVVKIIKEGKKKMAAHRKSTRAVPEVDDKVILSWNALAITSLARASYTLSSIDETRAKVAREAAEKAVAFIKSAMYNPETGKLTRIYSDHASSASGNEDFAFVDDYAYFVQSLRTLFDLTFDQDYLHWALELQAITDREFRDVQNGGYFQNAVIASATQTGAGIGGVAHETPAAPFDSLSQEKASDHIIILKPGTDTALPSPNGMIASNLLYLSSFTAAFSSLPSSLEQASTETETAVTNGDDESSTMTPTLATSLLATARDTINAFAPEIIQHPFLYASLLASIVIDTVGVKSMVVPMASIMDDVELESRGLRGFGRTVVRSPLIQKPEVLVCDYADLGVPNSADGMTGNATPGIACRLMRDSELDDLEDGFEGEEVVVPEVSSEVIRRREEMARRESVALEKAKTRGESLVDGDVDGKLSNDKESEVS